MEEKKSHQKKEQENTRKGIGRRRFIRDTSLAAGATFMASTRSRLYASALQGGPNNRIVAAVMGLQRGWAHVRALLELPNVDIAYLCDVDVDRVYQALSRFPLDRAVQPKGETDFRRILEDPSVDAIFIATPNHWHAPATIMSCAAGKHVYVEKPGSHNPREAEMMVEAARKYNRVVQMGNQRRSWPTIIEGIERLHQGVIGPLRFARCWYNANRPSIGHGKPAQVPSNLDYSLWQGPAPEQPYKDNLIHYNWHWHWHWGNGELGNNGIHALDIARWGLQVDYPLTVTYNGGRYHFNDDQETPDTGTAVYDFGNKGINWECSSCHPRRNENRPFVAFYGDQGTMEIRGTGYHIYDLDGAEVEVQKGPGGDVEHFGNFVDTIRGRGRLTSEIEVGQISTMLCHLGNIAYRTGHTVHFNPETGQIENDPKAASLWKREYREGWKPQV